MSTRARLLVAAASLLLVSLAFLPLWEVRLHAPQYPEGLGLLIRLHTVSGLKPNDLQSINGLNHYIGMKPIHPDAIPELRWMPWIVAGLVLTGLLAAIRGSRRLAWIWLVTFVVIGGVGLWDFWRWEYDYGHNLDMQNAILIVPGMTYQPPLIGSKQLLNFTASSWPAPGAWMIVLSIALVAVALLAWRPRRAVAA
jgi:hypothetical protein